jgi:transcriptional regulator
MYIPEHFRLRHPGEDIAFMRANPFAILISQTDDEPFATHLPLSVVYTAAQNGEEPRILLRGHVAKANPHWKFLERQPKCLTIFHGAHSYISPRNYTARESVPTWNYAAVHVYGDARLFSAESETHEMLQELVATFEPPYREQWESLSAKYRDNMLRQIVGFEITATKIESKFKLSQNRTHEDQANVITSLSESQDTAVSGVAQMMKERGLGQIKEHQTRGKSE